MRGRKNFTFNPGLAIALQRLGLFRLPFGFTSVDRQNQVKQV